jgi:RNA recognition motif-containing protein
MFIIIIIIYLFIIQNYIQRPYCFVDFVNPDDALNAKNKLVGEVIENKRICVEFSKSDGKKSQKNNSNNNIKERYNNNNPHHYHPHHHHSHHHHHHSSSSRYPRENSPHPPMYFSSSEYPPIGFGYDHIPPLLYPRSQSINPVIFDRNSVKQLSDNNDEVLKSTLPFARSLSVNPLIKSNLFEEPNERNEDSNNLKQKEQKEKEEEMKQEIDQNNQLIKKYEEIEKETNVEKSTKNSVDKDGVVDKAPLLPIPPIYINEKIYGFCESSSHHHHHDHRHQDWRRSDGHQDLSRSNGHQDWRRSDGYQDLRRSDGGVNEISNYYIPVQKSSTEINHNNKRSNLYSDFSNMIQDGMFILKEKKNQINDCEEKNLDLKQEKNVTPNKGIIVEPLKLTGFNENDSGNCGGDTPSSMNDYLKSCSDISLDNEATFSPIHEDNNEYKFENYKIDYNMLCMEKIIDSSENKYDKNLSGRSPTPSFDYIHNKTELENSIHSQLPPPPPPPQPIISSSLSSSFPSFSLSLPPPPPPLTSSFVTSNLTINQSTSSLLPDKMVTTPMKRKRENVELESVESET